MAVTAAWRRLTGGRPVPDSDRRTLIACSGGADSSALVLALAHHPASIVVAHVVHDMRPAAESSRCFESARVLAHSLGLRFVSDSITAKPGGGNYEAAARTLRYSALERLAAEHGCRFIATAHHAEDQLETILLRLLRGAGPQGMVGIRAKRKLASGITVIRPMLALCRASGLQLCTQCGWQWSEDATNADLSHRRAALRATVLPALRAIAPNAAAKSVDAARLAQLTADHLNRAAEVLERSAATDQPGRFDRSVLRRADRVVLLTLLHSQNPSVPLRTLESIARALRSKSGEPREWPLGPLTFKLTGSHLSVSRRADA